jgi:hypothetical protein
MKVLTCTATRRRLHAYYDKELPIADQIAVSAHVEWCDECAADLAELRRLSVVFRAASHARTALSREEATSLQSSVVSRLKAEQTVSFVAQAREVFADMHFVYAGLGGTAAALVCVLITLAMMRFATTERPDTLATLVKVLGSPAASLRPVPPPQPRIQLPRPLNPASFSNYSDPAGDSLIMMAALVTREGTVTELALLNPGGGESTTRLGQSKAVEELLGAVSRARFEPGTVDGLPVAVNMVWVVEHTTVRAKQRAKKRAAFDAPLAVTV